MRRSREINQRDTVVDHVILSEGQALEIADAPVSFLPPGRRHAIVKLACHPTLDLVEIERVEPVLEAVSFSSNFGHPFVALANLVSTALANRLANHAKHLIVQSQSPELGGEHQVQRFFSNVGFGAPRFEL